MVCESVYFIVLLYSTIQVFFFDSIEMVALSQWNPLLIRKKRCYQIYFLLNTYINLFKKKKQRLWLPVDFEEISSTSKDFPEAVDKEKEAERTYKHENLSVITDTSAKKLFTEACLWSQFWRGKGGWTLEFCLPISLAYKLNYWSVRDPVSKTSWMSPREWPKVDLRPTHTNGCNWIYMHMYWQTHTHRKRKINLVL